ncbi:ATP-binding protein [Ekhidna sp.]|uniref:sensor histidine kinase n=1 Tax=Ekhidna sp. TaxID=2608089 RepID=UPI003298C53E
MDNLIITLILFGAAILFLAILKTRDIFQLLQHDNFRKGWRKLVVLMSFFELGYFGMVYVIVGDHHQALPILTGVIFLMGSVFVFIVVSMGAKTCQLLKDSNEALEEQMKILKTRNDQLVQFNYATTHDLREPINTVLGCSTLLESDYLQVLDEDGQKLVQFTKKAAYRMSELVSALSEYLSIGLEFKREHVDVKNLVHEVIDSMNGSVSNSRATIEVGPMPDLNANKMELKRVFQNLIGNSIKYKRKNVAPQICVSAQKRKGNWLFAVKDNGIGISKKDIPRAFQLFRQLHSKDEYDGMGLGLSIARRVIELHGGQIWLESTVDEGTTFFFTLSEN